MKTGKAQVGIRDGSALRGLESEKPGNGCLLYSYILHLCLFLAFPRRLGPPWYNIQYHHIGCNKSGGWGIEGKDGGLPVLLPSSKGARSAFYH